MSRNPNNIVYYISFKRISFKYFLSTTFSYDCVKADVPCISASHCGKEGGELKKTLAFFLIACQLHSTDIIPRWCKTSAALIQYAGLNQMEKSFCLANASLYVNMVIKRSLDLHDISVTSAKTEG